MRAFQPFITTAAVVSFIGVMGMNVLAEAPATQPAPADGRAMAPAVKPKELSNTVIKGLDWIAKSQRDDGGWSQGEESSHMGSSNGNLRDLPNIADTCAAMLALIRSGSTPSQGTYSQNLRRGVDFLCAKIAKAPAEGLSITDLQGTRLQQKLGTHIDTFMAALVLAEVKD